MVRIRLSRAGAKKAPFYRIVVTDQRSPRGGRFIETIGTFDARREPVAFVIKRDRLAYWQAQGAQVSDVVTRVLKKHPAQAEAPAA